MVEVKGEVEEEKIIEVPVGSSIDDVLKQVDLNKDADTSSISRLDVVNDNQIIVVDRKEDVNKVSINTASIDELSSLPGIGIKIAERIVEYRKVYGSFTNLKELMNVSGIGEKKFEAIKEYICI